MYVSEQFKRTRLLLWDLSKRFLDFMSHILGFYESPLIVLASPVVLPSLQVSVGGWVGGQVIVPGNAGRWRGRR